MMIALVFCGDLKYCPYIKRYIERLEASNCEYVVLFWNRCGEQQNLPDNYLYFDSFSNLNNSKFKKAIDFYNFRGWVFKYLDKIKPQKIIALSTLTGVILWERLKEKKFKYIFDIRDYSYEYVLPFRYIEQDIIKSSFFTAISSKGFEEFLPTHNYVIAHNFNRLEISGESNFKKTNGVINFVWNGVIRYFEYQKQYLDALKNDERFNLVYHGDGPELDLFKSYCNKNNFQNVIFTGAYQNSQKEKLLKEAHILNNCYGYTTNAGNKLKYAISNRFYDGIIFKIPQLVEPEGFKTSLVLEKGLGTNLRVSKNFADELFEYYKNLNFERFVNSCNLELNNIIDEDDYYISKIDQFINI